MRLFIAIEFDNIIKSNLYNVALKIKETSLRCNVTLENNIHLTLKFLGDYNEDLEKLKKIITNTCSTIIKFDLVIEGVGAFGRDNNIIWAGINKNKELLNLHKKLQGELEMIGIKKEDRPFSPHITLAREAKLNNGLMTYTFSKIQTSVNKISLMESTRRNGVLTYLPLFKCSLNT